MKYIALLVLLALTSCQSNTVIQSSDPDLIEIHKRTHAQKLASINIMDRNGLSETISAKERVKNYENVNFLGTQPYQKVLRVFVKDNNGDALSLITSYYPTGQVRQFLECTNARAHGRYIEWHPNGQKKLSATILGGAADLDEKSQTTWVFQGTSICWNEDGKKIAEIPYSHGVLEGVSYYYYPSGTVSDEVPYKNGEIEGESKSYDEQGKLLGCTQYVKGQKSGKSVSYWSDSSLQFEEVWNENLLEEAKYFGLDGQTISQVIQGRGKRCIFGDESPSEIQEYVAGAPEGEVVLFNEKGKVMRRLFVKNGDKHGLETYYWPTKENQPKLAIEWENGQIHGTVKSWYEDGTPESSREMSHNQKQGHLTAWYKDGKVMLIEEYEKDKLVRGDYLKRGDMKPVSQVQNGKGVATFYDPDGSFRTRVTYHDGKPVIDDLLSER